MKRQKLFLTGFIFIFIFFSGITALFPTETKPEIAKLENSLLPPVLVKGEKPFTLAERMQYYNVPGVSITIIKDFRVEWTKGFGVTDTSTKKPVTASTLFQAASVSKPVTAMAVLKEAEVGKFKLEDNVNNYLTTWKLPDNKFTESSKVAIRNLITHTGGTTVHGFRGYTSTDTIPTLVQVLNGEKPANSSPVLVDIYPGFQQKYSGGGYCILQQLLIDTEKQPFPDLMNKLVLKPLGMMNSTYMQPLPSKLQKNAASGYRKNGNRMGDKWHIYPEMAAAGLWTTSEDLAKFVIEIQKTYKNEPGKVFSPKTGQLMLSPFLNPTIGMGVFLDWKGKSVYFNHGGANEGYRCFFIGHREKGFGAVIMTNGDRGDELYAEILRGIASIYQWDDYLPPMFELVKVEPESLKPFAGKYAMNSDTMLKVSFEENRLFAQVTTGQKAELFPIAPNKFIRRDQTVVIEFVKDEASNEIKKAIAERNGQKRDYERKGDDFTVPMELLLSNKTDQAMDAYRKLKAENPTDPMIQPLRLLLQVEELIMKKYGYEAAALLNLVAEFNPEFIKAMQATLDNEIRTLLEEPSIPELFKKDMKKSYNEMLRKLGLKELE